MANPLQFDKYLPPPPDCLHCEELLADAADASLHADNPATPGVLSQPDQARFDAHIATCDRCSAAFADALCGAAWLQILKAPRPEPPAHLLQRILAVTSEAPANAAETPAAPAFQPLFRPAVFDPRAAVLEPVRPATNVLPFRPRGPYLGRVSRVLFEPRLAMTAAMAFFSIALTMNLTGIRIDQLHASDLSPSTIRRQYFQTTAAVARRTESLRVVHVLEARVADFRDLTGNDGNPEYRTSRPTPHGAFRERNPQPAQPPTQPDLSPASKPKPPAPNPDGISRGDPATPRLLPVNLPTRAPQTTGGMA